MVVVPELMPVTKPKLLELLPTVATAVVLELQLALEVMS
jgi:hypothetical protein